MKLLLTGILIILSAAAANSTEIVADNNEAPITKPEEDGFVALQVTSAKAGLETARDSVDAIAKFVDIFNSDIFQKTPIKMVAEIITKVLSFIGAIINLIMGRLEPEESAEIKLLRKQFAEVNAKLDGISLQIEDVKLLIEWQSTRNKFAEYENHIKATALRYDEYLTSAEPDQEHRKRLFITAYEKMPLASLTLYQSIVETDFVVSSNLGAAVVHYTKNNQRQVMNFLLAMERIIMRGAQMDIAYERLVHCDGAGRMTEYDWKDRLENLLTRMKEIDTQVRDKWHEQMEIDVSNIYRDQRGLTNEKFAAYMYNYLVDKFHWRNWFSLAYNPVHGFQAHTFSECGGTHHFREHGRNIVVASYDPNTSRFTKENGDRILAQAESAGLRTNEAEKWYREIDPRIGGGCEQAAFRGAICWGCDVHWVTPRFSYRKITVSFKLPGLLKTFLYEINAILAG